MDELCQHHRPDEEVFCFLLMACIADKEAGLKHAIEVCIHGLCKVSVQGCKRKGRIKMKEKYKFLYAEHESFGIC